MVTENSPLVVLGALEEEIALLQASLSNPTATTIGAYQFLTGSLRDVPVVIGHTFMGMTNSAVAATLAIERFHPQAIISLGTAGAHDPALHTGDIVIATRAIATNAYISASKPQGAGSSSLTWDVYGTEVFTNEGPRQVESFSSDEILRSRASRTPYAAGRLFEGTISSGDCWNRELDRIAQLHDYRQSLCEDMETYSIAQTCWQLGRLPWLGIRIISNSEWYPDELFDVSVATHCQEFFLDFLTQL